MTRPRKVLRTEPPLRLYAAAEARAEDVRAACVERCKGCPGPESEGGCLTRKASGVVAGRADWPLCPLGMLQVRAWRGVVDLFIAAKVSPLAGFPEDRPAYIHDGLIELHCAVRSEEERKSRAVSRNPGGPQFTGRKTTRKGA